MARSCGISEIAVCAWRSQAEPRPHHTGRKAMKRLVLAMLLVPSLALAAEEKTATPSDDPMAGWVPPKVTNAAKDKQEIQALFRSMEAAARTGDLDAAAALVDFPVTMITDDSKGEATGEAWSRERWTEVMKPFYDKPMKDMKVTHKPNVFLLSDSLASVDDVCTMTQGGKTITSRNSSFVIRRDGKWRVKAMAEGGWGDMMAEAPQGTASSTQEPAPGSTGSAAEGTPSQGTQTGAQPLPERTTK
jgi:uncharacterized protein (TIGR02246 family)